MSPLLFLLHLIWLSHSSSSESCDSTEYHRRVRSQIESLSISHKYTITEGIFDIAINTSYTGSNPDGVYGTFVFASSINSTYVYEYPLSSSDAIIFAGCTMPKAKYFSFQHYINQRVFKNKTTIQLFADLGAATNFFTINTSSNNTNFNALTTVILTGDKQTEMDLRSVLDASTLNFLTIPNEYAYFKSYNNIYENETYDKFSVLYRMSLWYNNTEFIEYVNKMQHETVWKISPINATGNKPHIAYEPFTRDSNCNYNENIYNEQISEYKNDLITYIEQTYNYKYMYSLVFSNWFPPNYGFDCIDNNIDCIGETRDAQYWSLKNKNVRYDNNSFYLVLGINHVNTNQSVYISITMYKESIQGNLEPLDGITDKKLNQSTLILPVKTNVDKEYVANMWNVQLSRPNNCIYNNTKNNNDSLLIPGFCFDKTKYNKNDIELNTRNYLNPETKTHPNRTQIVPPMLLYFTV
eukprot:29627_1